LIRVAVDIGGTFTDLVGLDDESSRLFTLKIKSTPRAPEHGFVEIIKRVISENHVSPNSIESIVHVGTIGSNLFLGQLGIEMPKTALITTHGFRDVLEIGRQNRPELYNIFFQRPKPLIPRKLRYEIQERTDPQGHILREVDGEDLERVKSQLKKAEVDSVAVCFLNSYLNSQNEKTVKNAVDTITDFVSASFEVDPEHREYERTSTTVVNAILAPVLSRYMRAALTELQKTGITAPVQLLSSSGGLVDLATARAKPVVAVESGPAAGVVGASEVARILGLENVLSLDMGGTTAKAGCVVNYRALIVAEMEVGGRIHLGRAIKGSGYPVRYPSVDLAEVSAGGGTIIWADETGALQVGPVSAGAAPGPACYASGGKNPTITDANLILGRLGAILLGGRMELDLNLASRSMEEVAERAKMSLTEGAVAAVRLVNLHMAKALDIVSLERGQDPRRFALMAFGGAGPMHAAELAEQVGISRVVVPPHPGLFSALGMILTDMRYDYVTGVLSRLDEIEAEFFERTWDRMRQRAASDIGRTLADSIPRITYRRSIDVRYFGQGFELEIQAPPEFDREKFRKLFEQRHEAVYGYRHAEEPLEVTALRLTATIATSKPHLQLLDGTRSETRPTTVRKVWFDGWKETAVLWRDNISTSQSVEGPSVIEEYDSTTLVPPSWNCEKNNDNCLIMERKA